MFHLINLSTGQIRQCRMTQWLVNIDVQMTSKKAIMTLFEHINTALDQLHFLLWGTGVRHPCPMLQPNYSSCNTELICCILVCPSYNPLVLELLMIISYLHIFLLHSRTLLSSHLPFLSAFNHQYSNSLSLLFIRVSYYSPNAYSYIYIPKFLLQNLVPANLFSFTSHILFYFATYWTDSKPLLPTEHPKSPNF
jgi:hypothetical protein